MSTYTRIGTRLGLLLLGGLIEGAACSRASDTYVVLDFTGALAPTSEVAKSIAVDLVMNGRKDTTEFPAKNNSVIGLPTTAVLQIRSGSGELAITATAKDGNGRALGVGLGKGAVVSGKTVHIEVRFGPKDIDGGVDNGADAQSAPDDTFAGGAGGGRDVGGAGGGGADGGTGDSSAGYMLKSEPAQLDFGTVIVGKASTRRTLTIANGGTVATGPLGVNAPASASPFSVVTDLCNKQTLGPANSANDRCTIVVVFTPTASGPALAAKVSVVAGLASLDIPLSGTGVLPAGPGQFAFEPPLAAMGAVEVNSSKTLTFTVTNIGGQSIPGPIEVLLQQPSLDFALPASGNLCGGQSLTSGQQCTIAVQFSPKTVGPKNSGVIVKSPTIPQQIESVTGSGFQKVALVLAVVGGGTVTVTGTTISCQAATCDGGSYSYGDPASPPTVELIATPDAYSQFGGWSESGCGSSPKCTVTMNRPMTVTATFKPLTVNVTVNVLSLGTHAGKITSADGSLSCGMGTNCANVKVPARAGFTLQAKPEGSSEFAGWADGPPCQGANPTCTFDLKSSVTITATFGPRSYMFVTSVPFVPGNLKGLTGGDTACNSLATAAGLPGSYKAWLSSDTESAQTRVGLGGWVRTDGRPFARNVALLTAGKPSLFYPPRIDEKGNDVGPGRVSVATGGDSVGMPSSDGGNCQGFTSTTGSILYAGEATGGAARWAGNGKLQGTPCAQSSRLYCFRSDAVTLDIVPPPGLPGRRVFITTTPFAPGSEFVPDGFCKLEARKNKLAAPDSFIALLATSRGSATARLTPGAPWKRLDEVFVTRSLADLQAGRLLTPIELAADGVTYFSQLIWTGAKDPSSMSSMGSSCMDWTSPTAQAISGDSGISAQPDWFYTGNSMPCSNSTVSLLCIEP